jgi:DNA repair exonuclease SbcCD ATPase subunit
MQQIDFERERKNLQELISRLEVHLSEQTKLVEEVKNYTSKSSIYFSLFFSKERWKALQAQKRMEAMQDALNGEQRLYMEKLSRDRMEIQRSKDQLLEDQKIALASIYESRSQLADERAKVEALQKNFQEQKHRDLLQNTTVKKKERTFKLIILIDWLFFFFSFKIEAETRAQQKLVSEQIIRIEKREQELIKREEAIISEKRLLNELKQRLDVDQSTIKTQQEEIKQKLLDIEHANELIQKDKERLSQLYYELHALDGKSTGRLQQLQKSINNLRQQEEHMNEVKSYISKK